MMVAEPDTQESDLAMNQTDSAGQIVHFFVFKTSEQKLQSR